MIKNNTQDKLKFISYYRSSFHFLFVFQYDHSCYFFMRKTILEVQNMDVSRGSEICLINDLSYINVLIEPTKVKRCTFVDMKHHQKMQVRDIFLRIENVYDNQQILDFFPFVALSCKSDRDVKDDPNDKIKNVVFSIFCIETEKIVESSSCNVPPEDQKNLHPRHISLARSSNVMTTHEGERFPHTKTKRNYVPMKE